MSYRKADHPAHPKGKSAIVVTTVFPVTDLPGVVPLEEEVVIIFNFQAPSHVLNNH